MLLAVAWPKIQSSYIDTSAPQNHVLTLMIVQNGPPAAALH